MKKYISNFLSLLLVLFTLSCDDSDYQTTTEPDNEVIDDYKLVAVSDRGEIFEIGNNSGDIENVGQIDKENQNSFLSANSLISSEEKIYSVEYVYNPSPKNNLLIFDRQNETSQIIPLSIPSTINGNERGIIALAWDNNNLIGVLAENVLMNNSTKHIINIDLQDNSITELGITFNEDRISSFIRCSPSLLVDPLLIGILFGSSVGFLQEGLNHIDREGQLSDSLFDYYIKPLFWIMLFGIIPTIIVGGIMGWKIKTTPNKVLC
jgi:hypothetical protein